MGTDVWFVVEVRDIEGGKPFWRQNDYATEHCKVAGEPRHYLGTRDYNFFSIVTEVRGHSLPQMEIENWSIPPDVDGRFLRLYRKFGGASNESDAHSECTIYYPEIKAYKWNEKATKYVSKHSYERGLADKLRNVISKQYRSLLFHKLPKLAKQYGDKNVRMVLFFDN